MHRRIPATLRPLAALAAAAISAVPFAAFAQKTYGLKETADAAELSTRQTDILEVVGGLINNALGLVGILFFLYMLYGGYLWLTAGDDKNKPDKAKKIIENAVIGMIVIFSAYVLVDFFFSSVLQ